MEYPREEDIEEYIEEKVKRERCYYCGERGETYSIYNSIIGLMKENIYIVCNRCKKIQKNSDIKTFLQHIYKINNKMNEENDILKLVSQDFYYTKSENLYKIFKSKKECEFKITEEYFNRISSGDCGYCGIANIEDMHQNGIDRIDTTKGYIEGNIIACCFFCSMIKSDIGLEEFKESIRKIVNYTKDRLHLLFDSPFRYRIHKVKKDRELYKGVGIIKIRMLKDERWGEVYKIMRYDNIDPIIKSSYYFIPYFSIKVENPDFFISEINDKLFHMRINDDNPTIFKMTSKDIKTRVKTLNDFNNIFTRSGEKFIQYPNKQIRNFFEDDSKMVLERLDKIENLIRNTNVSVKKEEKVEEIKVNEIELTELQTSSIKEFLNTKVVKSPGQGCVGRAKLWGCYENWSRILEPNKRVTNQNLFTKYVCTSYFNVNDEWATGVYNTGGKKLTVNQCWRNHWIDDKKYGGKPDDYLNGQARKKNDGIVGFRKWSDY